MATFKVGDEVEVLDVRGLDPQPGTVIAVLHGSWNAYPVIVSHVPFGRGDNITQAFSESGRAAGSPNHTVTRLRHKPVMRVLNVYGNCGTLYSDGSYDPRNASPRWRTEEDAARQRATKPGAVGFLTGVFDDATKKVTNIKYTSLED